MKTLFLIWFHLKRILLNNWGYIVFTFGFPLVLISGFLFVMQGENNPMTGQDIVVVNHSEFVAEHVYPALSEAHQNYFEEDLDEAFVKLEQIEVPIVYEIPTDFPEESLTMHVHSLSGENREAVFESEFMSVFLDEMMQVAFEEAAIQFNPVEVAEPEWILADIDFREDTAFVVFMILFFMGYSSGIIAGDLAKLRKEGLLTRSVVSNSHSWQILGSILAAYSIFGVLSGLVIIALMSAIFNFTVTNITLIFSLFIAMSVFVAGLTMVLFRVFKNEAVIQILGVIIIIGLVFIPILISILPEIELIQYISPYYWVFEAMDTGQIFPNALVIILYGLVLFTAGSFKVERLVKG